MSISVNKKNINIANNKQTWPSLERSSKLCTSAEPESLDLSAIPSYSLKAKYLTFKGKTERLTKKDIQRLNAFQKEWAKSITLNESGETIDPIRLSPVKLGNAHEMTRLQRPAVFLFPTNTINLNPVREILSTFGGDERLTVHESVHSYLHNLRRACAKQDPNFMTQHAHNSIMEQLSNGEHGYMISGVKSAEIGGQTALIHDTAIVPQFSKKERETLLGFINQLSNEDFTHTQFGQSKLNYKAKKRLYEQIIPQMEDYKKYMELRGSKRASVHVYSDAKEYINALFYRRNVLLGEIFNPNYTDISENLNKPLTEAEKNVASHSLKSFSSTIEGNIIQQMSKGASEVANKAYLLSFEEKLARTKEIENELRTIEAKINQTSNSGKPLRLLEAKKNRLNNDLKLISLLDDYATLEQEIDSAPKDPQKMANAYKKRKQINSLLKELEIFPTILKKYEINIEQMTELNTPQEMENFVAECKLKLPQEYHSLVDKLFSAKYGQQCLKYIGQIENTRSPLGLLLKTPEMKEFAKRYGDLLREIKVLAKGSTLIGLPKFFFKTEADYAQYIEKNTSVLLKWCAKLAHR